MTKLLTTVEGFANLKHMKPLFLLGNLMGQYQPNNVQSPYKAVKWYKCYAICIIFSIIGVYIELQRTKFKTGIFTNTTAVVMNFMMITTFTIATIYAILENVFFSPSKLHSAFQKFVRVDEMLMQIQNSKIVEHKHFVLKLVVQHIVIFTILAFNLVWSELMGGKKVFKVSYLQIFESYQTFVTFLIITNCFLELRNRFKSTNLSLIAIFNELEVEKINGVKISKYIETLTIVYGTLTEIVDLFNDLFGWQILLSFVNTLIALLTSLNVIALFIPKYNEITSAYDMDTGLFIVVILDFTFFSIINNYILAKLADSIYEESKYTSLICYKILQETSVDPVPNNERHVRENLGFLAQEATLRSTKISAAGFFEVDYTMVFLLFTSVTTYIVVLIQFNM